MPDSTSRPLKGYILDTNVLSLFAKIDRLQVLLNAADFPLYVTPAIRQELENGLVSGVNYLSNVMAEIEAGHLQLLAIAHVDRQFINSLPPKLAVGEAEAIARCHRSGLTLISHDRKAINYCEREEIDCIRLTTLVDQFRHAGLLSDTDVHRIFAE